MKEIELTQGYVALVDDEDYERVSAHKWYAEVYRHNVYAARAVYTTNKRRKTVKMHRFILGVIGSKVQVDHKDRNGLNNQRSNLRITIDQNQQNAGLRKDNTSGYKGVHWNKNRGRWQARIKFRSKHIGLGLFTDILDAARAYNKAALELFGEFALLNVIPELRST